MMKRAKYNQKKLKKSIKNKNKITTKFLSFKPSTSNQLTTKSHWEAEEPSYPIGIGRHIVPKLTSFSNQNLKTFPLNLTSKLLTKAVGAKSLE